MSRKPTKLKPICGAVVQLNHDIHARNGRIFRAGLRMVLGSTDGEYHLTVTVRAKRHHVILKKRDYPFYFTVISNPDSETLTEE